MNLFQQRLSGYFLLLFILIFYTIGIQNSHANAIDGEAMVEQCSPFGKPPLNVDFTGTCAEVGIGYEIVLNISGGMPPYQIEFNGESFVLEEAGAFSKTLVNEGTQYQIRVTDELGNQEFLVPDDPNFWQTECDVIVEFLNFYVDFSEVCLIDENGIFIEYQVFLDIEGGLPPYFVFMNDEMLPLQEGGRYTITIPLGSGYDIDVIDSSWGLQVESFVSNGIHMLSECVHNTLGASLIENCIVDDNGFTGEYEVILTVPDGISEYNLVFNDDLVPFEETGVYTFTIPLGSGYGIWLTSPLGTASFYSSAEYMELRCRNNSVFGAAIIENCIVDENGNFTGEYEVILTVPDDIDSYYIQFNNEIIPFDETGVYTFIIPVGLGYNIWLASVSGEELFYSDGTHMVEQCGPFVEPPVGSPISENCIVDENGNFTGEYEVILTVPDDLSGAQVTFNGELMPFEETGVYTFIIPVGLGYEIWLTSILSQELFSSDGQNMVEKCGNLGGCDLVLAYPLAVLDNRHNDIVGGILFCNTDTIRFFDTPPIAGNTFTPVSIFVLTNREGDIISSNNSGIFPIKDLNLELETEHYELMPHIITDHEGVLGLIGELTKMADIGKADSMGFTICSIDNIHQPPLIILPPIKAIVDIICTKDGEDYTTYHLNVKVTGGLPAYRGMGNYFFSGGTNADDAQEASTLVYDPISKSAEGQINNELGALFMLGETYTFQIIEDGWGCSSMVYSETPTLAICVTTPITLVNFEAEVNTNGNTIQWITAHELAHDYFILEYTSPNGDFEQLTIIPAQGKEAQGASYEWHHATQKAGVYHYRLIAVDQNGERMDHGVVTVERQEKEGSRAVQISPIPATDNVYINWGNTGVEQVNISLYNTVGQVLFQTLTEGNEIHIPVQQLSGGIYYLSIDLGEEVWNEKIVVE